jgi:hypothetical protein
MPRNRIARAMVLAAALAVAPPSNAAPRASCKPGAQAFARTDLFFGRARPGGVVTEAQFRSFVDEQVTPRFPDGLTLLAGIGQFRDASGATWVEGANVLILLYPHGDARADRQIDAIRSDYRRRFEQQSVLRADSVSCVSF